MPSIVRFDTWQTPNGAAGPTLATNGNILSNLPTVCRVHNTNVSTTGATVIAGFGNTVIDTIGSSTFGSYGIRPQQAGTYLVIADLGVAGTSPGAWTPVMQLWRNGASIYNISSLVNYNAGHGAQQNLSRIVTANGTTDYFEIAWSHNNGTSYTINLGGFTMVRIGN
jgi:hypothetical protein